MGRAYAGWRGGNLGAGDGYFGVAVPGARQIKLRDEVRVGDGREFIDCDV